METQVTLFDKKPSQHEMNGVLKHGQHYEFTDSSHSEIIKHLEKVRLRFGMSKTKFSQVLGYKDSSYQAWVDGCRFSEKSFKNIMRQVTIMIQENNREHIDIPLDKAIIRVKKAGYKIYKQTTNWEEI
jgi:hypothetical protein